MCSKSFIEHVKIYVLYFVYDKYFNIEWNKYLNITIKEHKWNIYQKLTHKNTPKQKQKKTDIHTHKDKDKHRYKQRHRQRPTYKHIHRYIPKH